MHTSTFTLTHQRQLTTENNRDTNFTVIRIGWWRSAVSKPRAGVQHSEVCIYTYICRDMVREGLEYHCVSYIECGGASSGSSNEAASSASGHKP
eukprot:9468478-Pyramimonas_sp.AAC.1